MLVKCAVNGRASFTRSKAAALLERFAVDRSQVLPRITTTMLIMHFCAFATQAVRRSRRSSGRVIAEGELFHQKRNSPVSRAGILSGAIHLHGITAGRGSTGAQVGSARRDRRSFTDANARPNFRLKTEQYEQ
jgi:hypothetical protein